MRWLNRHKFLPFLAWLPQQNRASVGRDALVGLSGAILALPQSIAYALIAGLPPEYGLYAAIVPVLIACLWGSSWHLICGPTAAISIVLYASVSPLAVPASQDYIMLILLLTFIAGVFQLLLGMMRFGALVNFVSHSVVLGFTLGAAIVIALGQMPNLLGIDLPSQTTALRSLTAVLEHRGEVDLPSLTLGLLTLAKPCKARSACRKASNTPSFPVSRLISHQPTHSVTTASSKRLPYSMIIEIQACDACHR